jgi:hypothetical protein
MAKAFSFADFWKAWNAQRSGYVAESLFLVDFIGLLVFLSNFILLSTYTNSYLCVEMWNTFSCTFYIVQNTLPGIIIAFVLFLAASLLCIAAVVIRVRGMFGDMFLVSFQTVLIVSHIVAYCLFWGISSGMFLVIPSIFAVAALAILVFLLVRNSMLFSKRRRDSAYHSLVDDGSS